MKRAIKVIQSCDRFGQLEAAKKYAELAGVWHESKVKEEFSCQRKKLKF